MASDGKDTSILMLWSMQFSVDSEFPSAWDGNDARVSLASLYGLSSFTYATCGVVMLTYFSELTHDDDDKVLQTLVMLEGAFMCAQTVATVQADVVWLGRPSIWHAVDRATAAANTLLVMTNTLFLQWDSVLLYVFTVISGLAMLSRSRQARVNGGLGEYAAWHTVWHLWFPFGLLVWLFYTEYDEYNRNDDTAQEFPPSLHTSASI